MNINDLIDNIDNIVFVDKKNRYNITMIYNYKSDIKWKALSWTKKINLLNYTDWRLPTADELKTLLSKEFRINSKIRNSVMQNDFKKDIYTFLWTSSLLKPENSGNAHAIIVINVSGGKLQPYKDTEDWRYGGMYTCARCIMVR